MNATDKGSGQPGDDGKRLAGLVERLMAAIRALLESGQGREEMAAFLKELRKNAAFDINENDAVEMLAQQFVSRPLFEALFGACDDPLSLAMNRMLEIIGRQQTEEPGVFGGYESVREQVQGIGNAAERQKRIVELYDQFFKKAFPLTADKLGIVYTPVEVVDFIIHSVHRVLQQEFGIKKGLGAEGVQILDPFTGTGTFIVRLLQSGLISKQDLARKYGHELHAHEIVPLAYYIALVNIETAYHGVMGEEEKNRKNPKNPKKFDGLRLADTFLAPGDNAQGIRVIIGNPPYSAGQRDMNDNNQKAVYPHLDERIRKTYAAASTAKNKTSLYDSYIRAFRWASDRLGENGVVAFITNGTFIDKCVAAGFRKCLINEFSAVYCFNLRGAIRGKASWEAKKEGQNIFGIMTGVCIMVLVKKKGHAPATLYYHDIGDGLTRRQKLSLIRKAQSMEGIPWVQLEPDAYGDWLNHRTDGYERFLPMGDKATKGKPETKAIFRIFSNGLKTNRDAWCYHYSRSGLESHIRRSIEFFNSQSRSYRQHRGEPVDGFIDWDKRKFSWGRQQKRDVERGKEYAYEPGAIGRAVYRPFCKCYVYRHRSMNDMLYLTPKLFPTEEYENKVIQLTGMGSNKDFSCLMVSQLPDSQNISEGQCFPLYWYERRAGDYVRHDGITDDALQQFRTAYGTPHISKEDVFYYIYGLLHSPEYRARFANDLKKGLPRIPFSAHFGAFCQAGRQLAELHLNYETVEPYPVEEACTGEREGQKYRVKKMRFPAKGRKDSIIYNESVTLNNIPMEAYDYIINGRSAVEWVMRQYAITTDKNSGITNDPNDWSNENGSGNPRSILDLVKRVIRVSVETAHILSALPAVDEL